MDTASAKPWTRQSRMETDCYTFYFHQLGLSYRPR